MGLLYLSDPLNKKLGGPHSLSGQYEDGNNALALPGIEAGSLSS